MSGPNAERTFIMVKPDGVQRGLVGKIIERFEQKGFKLVALKMVQVSVLIPREVVLSFVSAAEAVLADVARRVDENVRLFPPSPSVFWVTRHS